MKKTWLFLARVLCSSLALFAQNAAQNASDFQTALANGQVTITGYSGSATDIRIPDRINGAPVTSIGDGAFYGTPLTSVVIPNSVTSIGEEAFDNGVEIIRADSRSKQSLSVSPVITVVNDTGYTFYYLYISPSDSETWGKDVLGDQVLYDGQSFRYALPYTGTWDIMAEDSDEDTYTRWLSITADTTLTLTLGDLGEVPSVSPVITVVNDTGYTFYYLYISPSDSDAWGNDVLGDQVLYDGQSFRYALPYTGTWDILAEDSDEDTYTRRLSITADTTLTLTLEDLD